MFLITTRSKVPRGHSTTTPKPKVNSFHHTMELRAILKQEHELTLTTTMLSKVTHILLISLSPNFTPFRSVKLAISKIRTVFVLPFSTGYNVQFHFFKNVIGNFTASRSFVRPVTRYTIKRLVEKGHN